MVPCSPEMTLESVRSISECAALPATEEASMADIHMSLAGMALTGWSAATYPNTKNLELQIPNIFRYSDKPVGCQPPNIVSIEAAGSILNQDQSVVPRKPKLLGVAGAGWRPAQDVLFLICARNAQRYQ